MRDILSDTFIQAVPDLTVMVRPDGTILSRLGGRELGKDCVGGNAATANTLEQMWSLEVAQRLCQLVRHSLKGRTPLDRKFRHADRSYEVRLRPQGIDRVLMVFRRLPADDDAVGATAESGRSQPIETRTQLMQRLQLAASEARLHERPLAVITVHLGGLTDIERAFDVTVTEQLVAAAALRLRVFLSREPAMLERGESTSTECIAPIADHVLAAVIENAPSRDAMRTIVQRMREALSEPFDLIGRRMRVTPAFGISFAPEDSSDPQELLNRARRAMHEAHSAGRAVAFHSDTLRLRALSRLDSEHELRWALEQDQFQLDYRPLYAVPAPRLVAVQAQPCWAHPVRGHVAAGEFLALAETSEIAREIGRWMLSAVCADLDRVSSGVVLRAIVGLCRRHVLSETVLQDVADAISTAGVSPERLALKITERALAGPAELLPRLRELRSAGVQVVVEHFGAGHIAMCRIAELPVDAVILDPMIVRELQPNERIRRICRSAIDVAHAFGWKVAAEEVNSDEQLSVLQELGCDLAGGEIFGAPRDLHQLLLACPPDDI